MVDHPNNKQRIITVKLMDLPKHIDQWKARGVEPDRYEFFRPAGDYVLFLRLKPKETSPKDE